MSFQRDDGGIHVVTEENGVPNVCTADVIDENEICAKNYTSPNSSSNEENGSLENYEPLPEEFFDYEGVPVPLVSKSWLSSLRRQLSDGLTESNSDSDSDSLNFLPLATLKKQLKRTNQTCDFTKENLSVPVLLSKKKKKKSHNGLGSDTVINRQRGRPRKSVVESNQEDKLTPVSNESITVCDDNFWRDSNDSYDFDFSFNDNNQDDTAKENRTVIGSNYIQCDNPVKNISEQNVGDISKTGEEKDLAKPDRHKTSFLCFECGKSFSAASTLKNHRRIHNGTLLKCTECHKGFITKYLLKCHMRLHNGDLFMCHKCDKGFTTAELLKVHSRGHTGDRPFGCDVCKRSFSSASNLSQHKQIHNSEKKFLCSLCGSSFSQKRCLDGHMLMHAEKNHICNVCGKLWARKSDLIEHMRVHTGVKPYCCTLCPQKFTQSSSLKRHHIVHMDVKPIQCLTCNKMFKCQEYYKRHMRKHNKEKSDVNKDVT